MGAQVWSRALQINILAPINCLLVTMAFMKVVKTKGVMKAKRVSFIAKGPLAKSVVFRGLGSTTKTSGGFKKGDLMKSKTGTTAVTTARKDLNIQGFVAVKKGTPLYKAA